MHLLTSVSLFSALSLGAVLVYPEGLRAQDPVPAPAEAAQELAKQDPEKKEPKKLELGERPSMPLMLSDIDGQPMRSRELDGHITVVTFWATRCPIMQGWEERYAAIHREYTERGVKFVTINSNVGNGEVQAEGIAKGAPVEPTEEELAKPYPEIRAYLRGKELPYRVLVDAECKVADLFQARTTPHVFVFNAAGELVYKGLIDDDLAQKKGDEANHHLRDVLNQLLEGETVEPFATREQGCAIKRPRGQSAAGAGAGRRGRGRGR